MSNMSYCRFQNTLPDLRDCYENFDELLAENEMREESDIRENDKRELRCRKQMIKLCAQIALDYGEEVGMEVDIVRPEREAA